jgi:type VI secretion system ImpM family protein
MSGSSLSLHAFGKLPLAGDFIHYRLEGDEARAFAGWLERGQALVEGIRRGGGEPTAGGSEEPRRFRFAFDPGTGRRLLFGVLWESHDRGALRRFPFALFASVEAAGCRGRPSLMPLRFGPGWDALDEAIGAFETTKATDDLFTLLDRTQVLIAEPDAAASKEVDALLGSAPAGEFWARLLGDGNTARRVAIFDLLVQAFLPFRKGRPEEVPVTVRLPLAGTTSETTVQCAFWVELLAGMLRGARLAPNLFLRTARSGGAPTALQAFFQRGDEASFAALVTRRYEADYVTDLTDLGPSPPSPTALGSAGLRQVEDDGAALQDLVRFRWIG